MFVFVFSINDLFGFFCCILDDWFYDQIGVENEVIELVVISVKIFDWLGCDVGVYGGFCDCWCDVQDQVLVKWRWDQVVWVEGFCFVVIGVGSYIGGFFLGKFCNSFDCCLFYFFVDGGCINIKCVVEDIGKVKNVVDLVWIV